ncbi:MAG: DUF134 domain-containing protein [Candidatus Thorarchaeota archaeon]|nr:MAG: hypothetical protein DRO73_00555 [Candidatus Thorarchaeota archaeon]RLI60919.1 MAG: hypothetical protein DRO93_05770 [Candidatus Thorarchaeota archaeon]
MHRRRRGARGRFPIQPVIGKKPAAKRMLPEPMAAPEPIHIDLAETEVLRLVDLEGLYQENAGAMMGLSRGTIWRLLVSARRKIVQALFEGRPLVVGHPSDDD